MNTERDKSEFASCYDRFFAIHEIRQSAILQALYFAVVASFFVTFYGWVERNTVSISTFVKGMHVCPPYFPTCGNYYFLESLPYGYTQGFFYVLLFLTLLYGIYAAVRKDWSMAHGTLLAAFLWKVIYCFALTYGVAGNFDYYDLALAFVLLFLRQKEYFAKVVFVTLYFVASTIKIHDGWILGNYFTSTLLGAPFFGDQILPIFTNIVIVMQMVGAWFLFSKHKRLQQAALVYFLLFHVYSGIIVNYRYITISIPALLILFGGSFFRLTENGTERPFAVLGISRKTLAGYLFVLFIICTETIGILIPGDQKKTLEGNFYGLYMFEANHQCISSATVTYADGTARLIERSNSIANNRCDPYTYWFPLKTLCARDPSVARIRWTFDHSINGHAFERLVTTEDACALEYKNLQHNSWIRLPGEAETLSRKVYKDGYGRELYPESYHVLATPRESAALPMFIQFYWALWCSVLAVVVLRLLLVSIP